MGHYNSKKNGFDFGSFVITKREILASFAIIAVMLILGFRISDNIAQNQADRNAVYQKAIHIQDKNIFEHGMRTNVGNAFVYGSLEVVDGVTFDEIGGKYIYIKKEEEHYNKHTRTVSYKDSNGKTKYKTETYWSWDYYDSWDKKCKKISFCGVELPVSKIDLPSSHHIETIQESSRVRFEYYAIDAKHTGTIYTTLKDNTISDDSRFFKDTKPDEALELCLSKGGGIVFGFFWILLIIGIIYVFVFAENKWLED